MGRFVLLDDEAGTPVKVSDPPASFRLSMSNPVTGRPYSESRWRDLPDYAAEVIESQSNLCGGEWDVLVEDGEVSEFLDIDKTHTVPARKSTGTRKRCPQCGGRGRPAWSALGDRCAGCWGQGGYTVMSEEDIRAAQRLAYSTQAGA